MSSHPDVVVVGAGVIGASIAYELARAGSSVVVVDKASGPGQGSTSASSAVVRFNYSTWDGVATAWESQHCWTHWADHLGGATDPALARYERAGMVMLDVDLAPVARQTALFDRAGIPYETWDAAELVRRVPGIDASRFWPPRRLDDPDFWRDGSGALGALWTPDAGYVDDPGLAAVNLAQAARRHGARFVFGRTVTALLGVESTRGVRLDDGSELPAEIVVNAAGPWSGALNRLAGVGRGWSVTTRPLRQEVHHVQAPPGHGSAASPAPVIADLDLGTYLRSTPGHGLLVGGTEPECDPLEWLETPEECNPNASQALFQAQVTRAARRLPALGVPGRATGIAGVYDVTQDWSPIYDRTERPGYFVAIGTSGNQFKNAPLAGKFLVALIEGRDSYRGERTGHLIDLRAFSRHRPRNTDSSGTVMG